MADPARALRQIIQAEVKSDQPDFNLLKSYLDTLKVVLAKSRQLSVRDVSPPQEDLPTTRAGLFMAEGANVGTVTGTLAVSTGNAVITTMAEPVGPPVRPLTRQGQTFVRESERDQLLAAMDHISQQSGPDPLVAMIQLLPHVTALYGSDERAEDFKARLRQAVDRRLDPVRGPPPVLALLASEGTPP